MSFPTDFPKPEENYRPRLTDSFVRECPSHIELVVDGRELEVAPHVFLGKVRVAVAEDPPGLVVNLLSSLPLTSMAVGMLLRARNDAAREGTRVAIRPVSPVVRAQLRELGLGTVLGIPD